MGAGDLKSRRNRGKPCVALCTKEGAKKRADDFIYLPKAKNKSEQSEPCSDVANGYKKDTFTFSAGGFEPHNVRYYIFSIGTQNSYR